MPLNDTEKVNVLLKEYDTLRSETQERLKIAYSHLGYAGAIVAFGATFLDKDKANWQYISLAAAGMLLMVWISILNWSWLARCAQQHRDIENRINRYSSDGSHLLSWEHKAEELSRGPLRLPRRSNHA